MQITLNCIYIFIIFFPAFVFIEMIYLWYLDTNKTKYVCKTCVPAMGLFHRGNKIVWQTFQEPKLLQYLMNMNYFPKCTSKLEVQQPCQISFKSMQGCRRRWEDKLKCVKILIVKDHKSAKICRTWIISPHALLDLWCNTCQVLFKFMPGCRRSWEDKLKCVNFFSVNDHNSAKICWT